MRGIDRTSGAISAVGSTIGAGAGTLARPAFLGAAAAGSGAAKSGRWVGSKFKSNKPEPPTVSRKGLVDDTDSPPIDFGAMGRGAADIGKRTVDQGASLGMKVGKTAYHTRNSPAIQLSMLGGGIGLGATVGKDAGAISADYKSKLQMVNFSDDGGGAFLYSQGQPGGHMKATGSEYKRMAGGEATGDLVFALHSLRNGG